MEQTLERRMTHKYAAGWAREDTWETLGTAKIVTRYAEQGDKDYDEEPGTMLLCEVTVTDPAVADEMVQRALEDTFGGSSCTHDYDCCGCVRTLAYAKRWDKETWLVRLAHYRNY